MRTVLVAAVAIALIREGKRKGLGGAPGPKAGSSVPKRAQLVRRPPNLPMRASESPCLCVAKPLRGFVFFVGFVIDFHSWSNVSVNAPL
jgi:hypothetical protein